MKKNKIKNILAIVFSVCMLFTACGKSSDGANIETSVTSAQSGDAFNVDMGDDDLAETIYTGKTVENEADLAIFKFNATLPAGYETVIDSKDGKQYASPNGSIIVKAQNFKEEFQELEVFADQGCAGIKLNNMLYQADTFFSEPVKTTVAGFDAIRYDYTITAYVFKYEVDANGEYILDDDGNPIITDEKEVFGEYVNRVYYFYSDEDVFYIICESPKDSAEAASKEFDEFINSITITKK